MGHRPVLQAGGHTANRTGPLSDGLFLKATYLNVSLVLGHPCGQSSQALAVEGDGVES